MFDTSVASTALSGNGHEPVNGRAVNRTPVEPVDPVTKMALEAKVASMQ